MSTIKPELNSDISSFEFENFEFDYWRGWMSRNFHVCVAIGVIYVTLVFSGKWLMLNKTPYKLKNILILWNSGFAVFSLIAFIRTFPDLANILQKENGFHNSVCSRQGQSNAYSFWSWVGTLSKVAELGDTAFLIARKHDIIFLHWFHHLTAMLYTWYIFESQEPCHRWLMTMNFFVHILMYSYFAIRAAGIKLSRMLAMLITSLQILQMFVGVYVNWYTWRALVNKKPCERSDHNLKLAFVMYTSYLILFLKFFYNSYFPSKNTKINVKKTD